MSGKLTLVIISAILAIGALHLVGKEEASIAPAHVIEKFVLWK
jgi:cathepsin L